MYEAFYGLREKPFNLTPDPRFLYLSEKHKEAFAHLLFGIKNRSGFVMVSGEIGTGKTTICRTLLSQLDEATDVAFIFNPCLSPEELLKKINEEFGIKSAASSVKGLIDELNCYLLERNARGKNCVLVIDEAQNLTPSVLEQVRLLSNLETETQKLLQIVLIGQPELMQALALDELRQLNQRITARYHLQALDRNETAQYITYRLRVAGAKRRTFFTPGAVKLIYRYSRGTPRVVNALCDRALLLGYTRESREITPAIVRTAAREIRGEQPKRKLWPQIKAWLPNPSVVTAGLVIVFAVLFLRDRWEARGVYAPGPIDTAATTPEGPGGDAQPAREARNREAVFAAPVPLESPVQFPAAPVAPEVDTSFAGLVDGLDPAACRNAAVQGLLRAWNLALLANLPADDSVASITAFAAENRMSAEVMQVTLEQLEAINLPALIRLHGRKRSVWSAVLGAEGDELKLTAGTETTRVPRDRVAECYLNEAVILWRDPVPGVPPLSQGMTGEDVKVLQVQLRALGRLDRAPTGAYDGATAQAVKRIQNECGLKVDGVAGPRTRMVLSSWLPGFHTPGLRALPPVLAVEPSPTDPETPAVKREASTPPKPDKAASSDVSPAPATPNPAKRQEAKRSIESGPPGADAANAETSAVVVAQEGQTVVVPSEPAGAEPGAPTAPASGETAVPSIVKSEELPTPAKPEQVESESPRPMPEATQPEADYPSDGDAANGTSSPSVQAPPLSPDEAPIVVNSTDADSVKSSPPSWTGNLPLVPSDPDDAAEAAP